jgi:hypothetical protein
MIRRPLFLAVLACCLACLAAAPTRAQLPTPRLWETSGTVFTFDAGSGLLNVNTRLGPKLFRVLPTALVLLNNHAATPQAITPGDQVTVTYRFDTAEVHVVHIFRETRVTGTVVAVTPAEIRLEVQGAVVPLRVDALSRVELGGIPLSDTSVLVNRRAAAIFEPGTLLLLSLAAEGQVQTGRIRAVDADARRITLAGRPARVIGMHPEATLSRNGRFVAARALRPGDRVRFVTVGRPARARIAALQVTRPAPR